MKVRGFVFLQCDEAVVGCVIAAVDFAHEGGHDLVCVSGAQTSEATWDSTLTLISLSSTMST